MGKQFKDYQIKLTDTDRQILSSYCVLSDCLSLCLGSAYEIVVHSLGIGDRFILKIINGEYSNRLESDSADHLTVVAVEQLHAMKSQNDPPITINFSTREDGSAIKSASIGIISGNKKLIGMMCLNFYMNTPFSTVIESFTLPKVLSASNLIYNSQGDETPLYETIVRAKQLVMNDPDIPSKFKRKEIIRILNEVGVFNVKKGVVMCSELLGITITTIYMHIRNLDK